MTHQLEYDSPILRLRFCFVTFNGVYGVMLFKILNNVTTYLFLFWSNARNHIFILQLFHNIDVPVSINF
jgi:hypothetical protein